MKNLFPFFAFLLAMFASSFTLPTVTPDSRMPMAHVDCYLKIEGVDGESTAAGHEKWIELNSLQFNDAAKTATIVRNTSAVSSPLLMRAAAQGTHFKKAVLHVRKAGGDGTYMQYELKNVLVTSYQTSGHSAAPTETIVIQYASMIRG